MPSSVHAQWLSSPHHREEFRGPVSTVHSGPCGFTQTHTQAGMHTPGFAKTYRRLQIHLHMLTGSCKLMQQQLCIHAHTLEHTHICVHSWPVAKAFKQPEYWNPAEGRTVDFAEVHSRLLIKVGLPWKLCSWPTAIQTRGVCLGCQCVNSNLAKNKQAQVHTSVFFLLVLALEHKTV